MHKLDKIFSILLFYSIEFTENSEAVYDVSSLMRLLASSSLSWPEGGGIESK